MKKQIVYTNEPAFVNREQELKELLYWINGKPNFILFMYGPKSSGKTTLIMKFIEQQLDDKNFDVKHFNLREMLISNYSDFIQAFFEVDYSKSTEDIKEKREYDLKLFKLSTEIITSLENKKLDPFVVMKKELMKISKNGKRPVIIIDELQALENIYMNGQRELLKELLNFFVAITKESHLCHVIIASSDGYFMNRLYNDSKLIKTSKFLEVDYLQEHDVKTWLNNIELESAITAYILSESQIETIWKFIGGSVWEISVLLSSLIPYATNNRITDWQLDNEIKKIINSNSGRLSYYANLNKNKKALFEKILSVQNQKTEFKSNDLEQLITNSFYEESALSDELRNLVLLNILSFNPSTSSYKIQGHSMFYGLKDYVENLERH